MPQNRVNRYRLLAAEAMAVAERMADYPTCKRIMLDLAAAYDELAERFGAVPSKTDHTDPCSGRPNVSSHVDEHHRAR
jgi:hypothetical protein